MPYRIRKREHAYVLEHYKLGAWRIKSHHATLAKARAALHLLSGVERGMRVRRK